MNNNNENRKTESEITITMNIGAPAATADGIEETQRQKDSQWECKICKCCKTSSGHICNGQAEAAAITLLFTVEGEREQRIRVTTCPSRYKIWEVVKDGTEIPLLEGKQGSIYTFANVVTRR